MAAEAVEEGIGLSNTRERLHTMYGSEHVFQLGEAMEGGLRVTLEIPWTEERR
jgi:LytS/YehU family sensor histidine kinase